jgi:hypothetical protein
LLTVLAESTAGFSSSAQIPHRRRRQIPHDDDVRRQSPHGGQPVKVAGGRSESRRLNRCPAVPGLEPGTAGGESQAVASAAQGGGVSSIRKTGGSSFGTTSVA